MSRLSEGRLQGAHPTPAHLTLRINYDGPGVTLILLVVLLLTAHLRL
jgi:hypothetical protein